MAHPFQGRWFEPGQPREDQLFRPLPNRLNQSVDNAFPRQPQNQQYDQISRIRYLSNLCNDLINARESYNNPVKYASFVTLSLLDNANFDLCSILPRYDKEHEELTHKLGCLIGCDSITFKLIFSDESLFDYFLDNFTRHSELSNASFESVSSSLYIWLLNGYLQRILPTSDIELASVQTSTWFKQNSKRPQTRKISKTPFQLLREDLTVNTADSFEENFEFNHSSYARLFQFVELLISSYTNTAILPSPSQIIALKNVVEAYTDFLLAPTMDHDLETFKARLRANRQFSHLMSNYLKSMLSNSALNLAFIYHFEILITLICPNDSILANPDALLLFKRFSAIRFIDLLDVLLDRLSNADIRTLIRLDLLQYYLVVLFNINFIRLLCDLHVSAINYLKPIQKRLNAVAETNVNSSTLSRLATFMSDALDNTDEKNVRTYLAIINDRLKSPFVTFPPSEPEDRMPEEDSFVDLTGVTAGAVNSTLSRRPRTGIPDYYVDSWNSMYYLTPKGIEQVLSGQARFDFSQFGKKIHESRGKCRWENQWLAEKLSRFALQLVHNPYVRFLRRVSNNSAVGPVVRPFMMPRSPPKDVPVYGKNIPRRLETINLRILASYPVMFIILCVVWRFLFYLLSFIF